MTKLSCLDCSSAESQTPKMHFPKAFGLHTVKMNLKQIFSLEKTIGWKMKLFYAAAYTCKCWCFHQRGIFNRDDKTS